MALKESSLPSSFAWGWVWLENLAQQQEYTSFPRCLQPNEDLRGGGGKRLLSWGLGEPSQIKSGWACPPRCPRPGILDDCSVRSRLFWAWLTRSAHWKPERLIVQVAVKEQTQRLWKAHPFVFEIVLCPQVTMYSKLFFYKSFLSKGKKRVQGMERAEWHRNISVFFTE